MLPSSVKPPPKAILGFMDFSRSLSSAVLMMASAILALCPAHAGDRQFAAAQSSASMPDGDAAARHAKRTACLKEAKARKLVGSQKAAFLKECFAAR